MQILSSIFSILNIIGRFFFFKKCGKKPWYTFIPIYSDYQLAKCSDLENEAHKFMALSLIIDSANFMSSLAEDFYYLSLGLNLVGLVCLIPYFVYSIRIYGGICDVFSRRKRWVWLWIFAEWFCLLYWGISKKFVPHFKEKEKNVEESGFVAASNKNTLTVNIKERSVKSMFKTKTLLKDIHLNIEPGHMVLLLGGSGAGKTTFLNAVTGYEQADAVIELGENDLYKNYDKMKYDIGFVPQQDLMRGNDTVNNTITDTATLRLPTSVKGKEKREKVDSVLDSFGIGMLKKNNVSKLSGGQKKRLSIAMEFITEPKLFILDEPDSGLDGIVARELFLKLRQIADSGKIVIVITHTPDRVIDLFDDVVVLAKDSERTGRLTYFGPVDKAYEFFEKDSMEGILYAINQKEEGGEGRANELIQKYNDLRNSEKPEAV